MAEQTLTGYISGMERRVGALEEEQSSPDSITRVVKGYGAFRIRCVIRCWMYRFRTCSETLMCSESLII